MSAPLINQDQQPPARQPNRAPWLTVTAREVMVKLKDKTFIFATLFTVVLMIAGAGIGFLASRDDVTTIAVTDPDAAAVVAQAGAATPEGLGSAMESVQVADPAAGEALVSDGEADAVLTKTAQGWELVSKDGVGTSSELMLRQAATDHTMTINAQAAGTTLEQLQQGSTITTRTLDGEDESEQVISMITGGAFALLFYMASIMFGMQIAASVVEEKQSRIVEILATAIPVRHLLAGKVLGNTVLAFIQMVLYAAIGMIALSFTPFAAYLPMVAQGVGWFIAFFVVGFLALACVWAAAGSMATRNEDLNSTATPVMLVIIAAFFGAFLAKGPVAAVLAYVPVISSILMPMRLVQGEASWWQALIALVLTLAFTVGSVLLGERMYRRGLLKTSGKLGFREALSSKEHA